MSGQFNTTEFLQTITGQIGAIFKTQFDRIDTLSQALPELERAAAAPRDREAEAEQGQGNQELLAQIEELEQQVVVHNPVPVRRNPILLENLKRVDVPRLGMEDHTVLPVQSIH
ncbi:unnamed protein product [Linum trigynum]|uniref:Uncharacterized protein n=1 Tax=Linum trigynum TaxID=586398 RepID=A0AAV2CWW6_9ROSI